MRGALGKIALLARDLCGDRIDTSRVNSLSMNTITVLARDIVSSHIMGCSS